MLKGDNPVLGNASEVRTGDLMQKVAFRAKHGQCKIVSDLRNVSIFNLD